MSNKRNKNIIEPISYTMGVLLSFAAVFEPLLMGYHDIGAYERHKAYEYYRQWKKLKDKGKKNYILSRAPINQKEYRAYYRAMKKLQEFEYLIEQGKGDLMISEKGWMRVLKLIGGRRETGSHDSSHDLGKTYLIVFDVPERFRRVRDQLRRCLYGLGFVQTQKSIFATEDGRAYRIVSRIIQRSDIGVYAKGIIGKIDEWK